MLTAVDERRHANIAIGASSSHAPLPPPPVEPHHALDGGESDLDTKRIPGMSFLPLFLLSSYALGTMHNL